MSFGVISDAATKCKPSLVSHPSYPSVPAASRRIASRRVSTSPSVECFHIILPDQPTVADLLIDRLADDPLYSSLHRTTSGVTVYTSPTKVPIKADQQVSDAKLRTVQRTAHHPAHHIVNTVNWHRNLRAGCLLGMATLCGTLLYLDRGRDAATAYIDLLNKKAHAEAELMKGKAELVKGKAELVRAEAEKIRAATRASPAGK
ncbi:hypothetical protein UCRPA7_7805 [Phaeoacremonium minimum UCRPA7]|uniref:Uncharacterized protein n=1 Tax=Phaeoacremonium minimum (strain UCR-PA7) TaxID=1286976 RepID=R8BBQ6_PHAM7|nr:hypothetical protein UCRPA7_7805 [Phaeoacremonium minimum UCRPA7]EON96704.1 hypothetical protein UCRPA7_7805 [Phaeoacremonium minimum UCRPA7]